MGHKTFIVIGAMDGVRHDSLFDRLKRMSNIKVIFVEPVPYQFVELMLNTCDLNGDVYYEFGAVSNKNEDVIISYVGEQYLEHYDDYIDGCSCVIENGVPLNVFMRDVKHHHLNHQLIRTITFEDLMNKYGLTELDYLQIDTEGYDQRIIESIDFNKYNIKEVKFERHYLEHDFIEKVKSIYSNYDCYIEEGDVIFKRV